MSLREKKKNQNSAREREQTLSEGEREVTHTAIGGGGEKRGEGKLSFVKEIHAI